MNRGRALILLALAFLAACTMRSAMDALTSPEDRAFAQAMVDNLRGGNEAWLQQHFRADLWEESQGQLAQARSFYPAAPERTDIVAFSISSNGVGATAQRRKDFTLVTQGGGRWTVTRFETYAQGGADQVVAWRVVPHTTPPAELTMIETWDAAVPWIWAGLVVVLVLVVGIVVLIVRHNRRKRDQLRAGPGTP